MTPQNHSPALCRQATPEMQGCAGHTTDFPSWSEDKRERMSLFLEYINENLDFPVRVLHSRAQGLTPGM